MATALQLPPPDTNPAFTDLSSGLIPRTLTKECANLSFGEFDLKDNRYPTLSASLGSRSPASKHMLPPTERTMSANAWRDTWADPVTHSSAAWTPETPTEEPVGDGRPPQDPSPAPIQQAQTHRPEDTPPYTVSSRSGPRAADRYARDEQHQRIPSKDPSDSPSRVVPEASAQGQDMGQHSSGLRPSQDQAGSLLPSTPKHPLLPAAGIGAGPSSPIVPLSAGPPYNPSNMQIPISPNPRAYAQHPTYITPSPGPNSMNPTYAPQQGPREEVCVECAMRDQDMADVDVTSPGVWERESDVLYEELVRRELEEEAGGVPPSENSTRPRARGGPLSEENLRIWISINPKEPSSRQQTLDQYVRTQRTLLEAEVLAHARAMRESQQLDNRMRDTYSQLRRSAYELGSTAQLTDDIAGVRIKPPRSASMPSAAMAAANAHHHGREVTLLENGMIVEHVDVRREEKEVRERRRREEKRERSRARKSSRGSAIDVASVYSMPLPSQLLQTDSGFFSGVKGSDSRYSQSFSPRPSSVLTMGGERPQTSLRAASQASFSDMQSVGSTSSPRRSRFLGFKNLASGWRSSDSLAPSGSMMDMHVALQREQQYLAAHPIQDLGSSAQTLRGRESQATGTLPQPADAKTDASKKKNGLKKIWKIVTGSASKNGSRMKSRIQSRSLDRAEDDMPLAPPPPLSYLVDRDRGLSSRRHVSTASLPSSASPNALSPYAASPPTAPSSLVPSPTSSRPPGAEKENWGDARSATDQDHQIPSSDTNPQELETRGRATQSSSKTLSSLSGPLTPITLHSNRPQSVALRRDKSLPPLPGESSIDFPDHLVPPMPDARPQTMYTYDPIQISSGNASRHLLPPQAPFRTGDGRRQSFGGVASQPHPAVQSLPFKLPHARGTLNVPPFLAEERYGEFGSSRLSLSQWEATRSTTRAMQTPLKPKNRRSKFGLSSLFGKKSSTDSREASTGAPEIPEYASATFRTSASGDEGLLNGHSGPESAHSSGQRMSVTSRKNIAELVDQDPEFVAYRYPSTDQRLDLLR